MDYGNLQWHPHASLCRYSSYGRHFTKLEQLGFVAKKLEVFINPGDTIVDFSCGSNLFLPLLKRHCLLCGKAVSGRAFDIITPCTNEDFQQISWFDVTLGTFPSLCMLLFYDAAAVKFADKIIFNYHLRREA